MTTTVNKAHKLSHRWGQLFSNFLLSPEDERATSKPNQSVAETESPQSLHSFMQQTLQERRTVKPAADLPTARILFVSEDNAARTQVASAYARFLGGEQVFVRSVGTTPAFEVNPLVIEVLKERNVPTDDLKPKTINPHTVANVDEVVLFSNATDLGTDVNTWDITKKMHDKAEVHAMCDAVEKHVRELLQKHGITPQPHNYLTPEFLAA